MFDEVNELLDTISGSVMIELIRSIIGAPPEYSKLVIITEYLELVHQALCKTFKTKYVFFVILIIVITFKFNKNR